MSLRVLVALEVLPMDEEGKLIQISRIDTSVNPNPEDVEAELVLAEKVVDRLLDDVGREVRTRFREYTSALGNMT